MKPYLEQDFNKYPFPHSNVSDIKYASKYQSLKEETKLFNLFKKIKLATNIIERKNLIQQYYISLDRKYNDQTVSPEMPKPEKVGICIDRIVENGVKQIGFWATATNSTIYPWMVAGTSSITPTYGDTMFNVTELSRVNCVTDDGFLDAMNDGWNASGGFVRGTPTGIVAEMAMANTSTYATSKIFDRSVLPLGDRIEHQQNEDSFTLSSFYIVTSI